MTVRSTIINLGDTDIKPYKINDFDRVDYIPFGSDNQFPQACALLARSSPNHRGVINSRQNYIGGDGIKTDSAETEYLLTEANYEKESITAIAERLMLDYDIMGNAYVEVITDANRSFLWFNQLDATMARLSKDLKSVMFYNDWKQYQVNKEMKAVKIPLYPNFSKSSNKYGAGIMRSVYHIKDYEPEYSFYGIPHWLSGRDNIEIDFQTNRWNLARLKNSFRVSGILIVPVKDKGEAKAVLDNIETSHIGEGKNNKLLTITKSRAREGEKADVTQLIETKQDDKGSWGDLINMSMTQTVIAHSWFRSLVGIPDNTGFDTKRILNEYEIALNTIIRRRQMGVLGVFNKILLEQKNIAESGLFYANTSPLQNYEYMFVWEARQARGLDFDENDERQQALIMTTPKI